MKKSVVLAGSTALLSAALPVFAQTSPISDSLTVYAPDGSIAYQVSATEADELAKGPAYIYTLPGVLIDQSKNGLPTILVEPNVPGQAVGSDIFGIANIDGGAFLAFSSDVDGVPFPYGNSAPYTYLETGQPVDATQYLDPSLQQEGYTAQFWSDAEGVPDGGATALLLGLGLAGLAAIRRTVK